MNLSQAITRVTNYLVDDVSVRRATIFLNDRMTVKATRQRRHDGRDKQETFLLTFGRPNFVERQFINMCKKAGEPFPVKKVQIKFWPSK